MGRRGILPSVGAGTSLTVAGVLCLAVISSIIAFRGFPGLGPDVTRPPLRLATPAAERADRTKPGRIVVGASAGTATLEASFLRSGARDSARARADGPAV